jgi:hypothetical protein
MIAKFFVFAAAGAVAVAVASAALADSATTAAPEHNPTWSQSILLLKKSGYTHPIIIESLETPGAWIGSAAKDGRRVDVAVDAEGHVTEQ